MCALFVIVVYVSFVLFVFRRFVFNSEIVFLSTTLDFGVIYLDFWISEK